MPLTVIQSYAFGSVGLRLDLNVLVRFAVHICGCEIQLMPASARGSCARRRLGDGQTMMEMCTFSHAICKAVVRGPMLVRGPS